MTTPHDISSSNSPIRETPEAADRLLDPMTALGLVKSASDDALFLEEKKSMESIDIADVKKCYAKKFYVKKPSSSFPAASGRYRLVASLACPQSQCALMVRALKGLQDAVPVTLVRSQSGDYSAEETWILEENDDINIGSTTAFQSVKDLYEYSNESTTIITSTASIPLLWDNETQTIVNNNTNEIMDLFNSSFQHLCNIPDVDIEESNDTLTQARSWLSPLLTLPTIDCPSYRNNVNLAEITLALERANVILCRQRYLTKNTTVTTADLALFINLIRLDDLWAPYLEQQPMVARSYPALVDYCRDIYSMLGVADVCDSKAVRAHFFGEAAPASEFWALVEGVAPQKRHLLA